jgi:hypothetical protein
MIGDGYWATGITVWWRPDRGWTGEVCYFDDGWIGDNRTDQRHISTEGVLRARYPVEDGNVLDGLTALIDVLKADAEKLGITWHGSNTCPRLCYRADGYSSNYPAPDGWIELLATQSARLGWKSPYTAEVLGA